MMKPQTDDDFIHAAWMMEELGGGFAQALAVAYYRADATNRTRLRDAFPDLFTGFFQDWIASNKEK